MQQCSTIYTIVNNLLHMTDLTMIMLIMTIAVWFASILLRRNETYWISLIISVCGFCSMLIDNQRFILLLVHQFSRHLVYADGD